MSRPPDGGACGSQRPGILFIVNSLAAGGAERHVVTLLNHLDTGRFRLHLAYLKKDEALLPQLRRQRLESILHCGVSAKVDWAAVRRLRTLIDRHAIDLLVCTNVYPTLHGVAARMLGVRRPKLASVLHTTLLYGAKQQLAMQLYKLAAPRFDLLLYVCEQQRRYWRTRGLRARNDAVEHNGIEVSHFAEPIPVQRRQALRKQLGFAPHDYVIGLCAALRPEKAHGDLLRALAALRASDVPAKALLIGDGPERSRIERASAELGVSEHVRITGFQSDVRPWIAICDVMTLVSHAVETFSLAALESMACGKPLVMTDIGGASEQIVHGQHGFLFAPGDIGTLTEHLAHLGSASLRETLGAAAAERVSRCFTLERMVAGYERRFDELLCEGRAPVSPAATRADSLGIDDA